MTSSFDICLREQLNPEQYSAVTHGEGPLLVLAGAGSGKTRVLAYRLAFLLNSGKCKPWEVMAVTFTNKAADEMRFRITSLLGVDAEGALIGTFHRSCAMFLRMYGEEIDIPPNFDILDDHGSLILVKRVMRNLDIDTKKQDPKSYRNAISAAKDALLTPEEYEARAFDNWTKKVAKVYHNYQRGLAEAKSLDFDDLIMQAVFLLDHGGNAYKILTKRFKYILVDEYQDINYAQYRFVSLLASKSGNLAVVGDDDQAIYGFRGADRSFILNFKHDFPDAQVVKLERNYRSSGNILKCANQVVERNDTRRVKVLWTDSPEGELIVHYMATNEEDEAHFCASTIDGMVKQGEVKYNDCAVLYRTNAQSRSFEEVFSLRDIPHQIIGGIRFYERKEIKDIISYLKVINNPWSSVALERIINNPTRGIGPKSYETLIQVLTERNMNLIELAGSKEALRQLDRFRSKIEPFLQMMLSFHELRDQLTVYALTIKVLNDSGYLERLKESDSIEAESRMENIEELLGSVKRYDEAYPTEGLPAFLEQVTLISDIDHLEAGDDSVKIMTCHSAKGLEFDFVFLTGLEEGLLPHSRAIRNPEDIEEERRLCYVGITRAKRRLYLTWALRRLRMGGFTDSLPSRFLREMPPELLLFESGDPEDIFNAGSAAPAGRSRIERASRNLVKWEDADSLGDRKRVETEPSAFKRGDRVSHTKWGEGEVLEVRDAGGDHFVTVRFDDVGSRLLSENKANLVKVE